jgi:hypothetical protein
LLQVLLESGSCGRFGSGGWVDHLIHGI